MSNLSFKGPKLTTRLICIAAMLIAIEIILDKTMVGSDQLVKIGFGFIGVALIGRLLGPWWGGIAMALSDIIANTILATSANFFIGFTIGAFISGMLAGMFLYNQPLSLVRQFIYQGIQILVTNIILNTLWLVMLYHVSLAAILPIRLIKNVILFPIEAVVGFYVLVAVVRALHQIKLNN